MRTQKWICGAVLSITLAGCPVFALDQKISYYPQGFYKSVDSGQLHDEELKKSLFQITSTGHQSLGYKGARQVLFGELHRATQANGKSGVEEIYCHDVWTHPGIPDDSVMNTEHTWPQSRFIGKFPNSTQKSDLHHLFPSLPSANSTRGSWEFGDVVTVKHKPCEASTLGYGADGSGRLIFEVPPDHKGNTARAILYFSVRYQAKISASEEASLKAWHRQDPVDAFEAERNNKISQKQGNRNPFIDHPELVELISDF